MSGGATAGGRVPVINLRVGTPASLLFASWVELDAVLSHDVVGITVMNGTDQDIRLGIGASGSEADYIYVGKGAATSPTVVDHAALISKGDRLAVRALAADATTGTLNIILWG